MIQFSLRRLNNRRSRSQRRSFFLGVISLISILWFTSVTAAMPTLTTADLLQQAKETYQSGNFQQSQQLWQELVQRFASQDDKLNQAMAFSNLSLTAQQMGEWETATQAIAESKVLLEQTKGNLNQFPILAQTLDIQGQLQLSQGQPALALESWQEAATLYQEMGNISAKINNQINQAQAYQNLGMYPRACQTILTVLEIPQKDCSLPSDVLGVSDKNEEPLINFPSSLSPRMQLSALRSLGNTLRILGKTQDSYYVLAKGWQLAKKNNATDQLAEFALSLGNTSRAIANQKVTEQERNLTIRISPRQECLSDPKKGKSIKFYWQAATCYQQVINSDAKETTRLEAQLNLLNLEFQWQSWPDIQVLLPKIEKILAILPPEPVAIKARLKLAQSLMCLQWGLNSTAKTAILPPTLLQSCPPLSAEGMRKKELKTTFAPWIADAKIANLVQTSLEQSRRLGDSLLEANALGFQGAIAYIQNDLTTALQLTEQARLQISNFNHPEIAYLWQWQLGRILQRQGQINQAIAAYKNAYTLLQSLRQVLVGANADLQFTFRDRVEPVYRELVDLLLQSDLPSQEKLQQSRDIIESLQVAELNNFFQEACLEGEAQTVDQIDSKAAVIYAITLPKRLALIVSLPNHPLQYFETTLAHADSNNIGASSSSVIEPVVQDLMTNILNPSQKIDLRPNQQLYQWLIRPLEPTLQNNRIETLVFVLDGVLRGIPISTLHDGTQYLLEKYDLALVPSLRLLPTNSKTATIFKRSNALIGGLDEARQGFNALPAVATEIKEIKKLFPSEVLMNEAFTPQNLQLKLSSTAFPIVHLATHAQFSSKAEDTFLLTWDDRINVKNLDELLRETEEQIQPIELLILSACQTAAGDDRAPLGLAGVAVRSGAKSTLATLWPVNDQSTSQFIVQFYSALQQPGITKAHALHQAQLALLQDKQYQHPYYWGPFVLIGNWR